MLRAILCSVLALLSSTLANSCVDSDCFNITGRIFLVNDTSAGAEPMTMTCTVDLTSVPISMEEILKAFEPNASSTVYGNFTEQDLLSSCPGGPGSVKLLRADRCMLVDIIEHPKVRIWMVLGDPQLNCGGAHHDITVTLGGQQTISQTTSFDAKLGIDVAGIEIGGGVKKDNSKSITLSQSVEYQIPPGRQAVYVAGTAHRFETGRIQVNYGSPQYEHYIWYSLSTVAQFTPIPDDVEYDVHETNCGTDPRDLSGYHSYYFTPDDSPDMQVTIDTPCGPRTALARHGREGNSWWW